MSKYSERSESEKAAEKARYAKRKAEYHATRDANRDWRRGTSPIASALLWMGWHGKRSF